MPTPPIKADTGFTTTDANGYVKTDILQKLNGDSWLAGYATTAAVAAGYQPLDSELTAIAALTTTAFGRSLLETDNAAAATTLISALPLGGGTLTGALTLASAGIVAGAATVSATEVSYLDGVTSAIQTQINSKLATSTAASTYFPLAGGSVTPVANARDVVRVNIANGTRSISFGVFPGSTQYSGIWLGSATPDDTNFTFLGSASTESILNSPSGSSTYLRVGNANCVNAHPAYTLLYGNILVIGENTSGPRVQNNSGVIAFRNRGDSADAAITTAGITASGTVALRNGGSATSLQVHGTYTDSSNYVRAALSCSTTAVTLAAESAGGGANLNINLTPKGAGYVSIMNGANYTHIQKDSGASGRLHFMRPDSTTSAVSIGGFNDELYIRSGAGKIHHSSSDFAVTSVTGGLYLTTTTASLIVLDNTVGSLKIATDGVVQYGTHSAIAAETVTGYITIKDSGGTTRKLAVVS